MSTCGVGGRRGIPAVSASSGGDWLAGGAAGCGALRAPLPCAVGVEAMCRKRS